MSTLWISEYNVPSDVVFALPEPALVEQTPVTISSSSARSAAFGSNTNLIRVVSDVTCTVVVGGTPTATANNKYLPANLPTLFRVAPGQMIAAITAS